MSHGLKIRGDSLYCPLAFSLDSYSNCLVDCWHCWIRRLNHIWGSKLNLTSPEELNRKLHNGLKNPRPKSSLAWALKRKVTIRLGNKSDPFQPIERTHKISEKILEILSDLQWPFVIKTMCTHIMMDYENQLANSANLAIIQPVISPGAELDWETFERKRTTPVSKRIKHLVELKKQGLKVAVNGEPFIPGFHTVEMFEDIIKRLKSNGIKNYNTYNFHFNDFVAKRLLDIGIDIEKIWEMNQDKNWKPIQHKLCEISKKHDIILGCPDFVNVPKSWNNETNTCCGINVSNPTTYNTHSWRNLILEGKTADEIIKNTWDGIGDKEEGRKVLMGKSDKMYTMRDAGLIKKDLLF